MTDDALAHAKQELLKARAALRLREEQIAALRTALEAHHPDYYVDGRLHADIWQAIETLWLNAPTPSNDELLAMCRRMLPFFEACVKGTPYENEATTYRETLGGQEDGMRNET